MVRICALSLGSAPLITSGGELTKPEVKTPGPQGSETFVSVVNDDPEIKLSHSVVAINLKDTLLLSASAKTPGNPLLTMSVL